MTLVARIALCLALASSGCAHKQLTNAQVARGTVTAASVVGLVVLMVAASTQPLPNP